MKTILTTHQQLPRTRRFSPRQATQPVANRHLQHTRAQGVALIIVLAIIVLVATLVIGFLTLATSERRASTTVAQNAETRLLAENAVDLVMGQIRAATTNLGNTKTWASQPGMIRVYGTQDDGQSDGLAALNSAYKLYSSGTMLVTSTSDIVADELVNNASGTINSKYQNWWQNKGVFVDINEPVTDENGNQQYPIIDGSALSVPMTARVTGFAPTNSPNAVAGNSLSYYVDSGTCSIQGFGVNPAVEQSSGNIQNPAAMPVEWLYQLKDGTLIAPDITSTGTTTFQNAIEKPSPTNPIVGRVAFWTDDESCKININTASQGTYWDVPKVYNTTDYGSSTAPSLTYSEPIPDEFQRYPGHPATVCLSAALGHWFPVGEMPSSGTAGSYATQIQPYYLMAPRVQNGGSLGGTVNTSGSMTMSLDNDRLYTSVDEMFFSPALSAGTTGTRTPNADGGTSFITGGTTALDANSVNQLKFVLTANSRAPEVTLFNTPRMSLWPQYISSVTSGTGAIGLLKFCSTIGNQPFYLQRQTSWPASLNSMSNTSSASAYQNLSAANSTLDWGISRNQTLFKYMQALTANSFPGFSAQPPSSGGYGTFVQKYAGQFGAGTTATGPRDQILTEIFDYIRSGVDTWASTDGTPNFVCPGDWSWCDPMQTTLTSGSFIGMGRNATITEASLVFYATNLTGSSGAVLSGTAITSTGIPAVESVQAILLLNPYVVSTGAAIPMSPDLRIQISGLNRFQLNSSPLGFPVSAISTNSAQPNWTTVTTRVPQYSPAALFSYYSQSTKTLGSGNEFTTYPFWGTNAIQIPITLKAPTSSSAPNMPATTMTFTGGVITIKLLDFAGNAYQTLYMNFPNGTFPVPQCAYYTGTATGFPVTPDPNLCNYQVRLNSCLPVYGKYYGNYNFNPITTLVCSGSGATTSSLSGTSQVINVFTSTSTPGTDIDTQGEIDVVRSVELLEDGPLHGDVRVLAGLNQVPESYFGIYAGTAASGTANWSGTTVQIGSLYSTGNFWTGIGTGQFGSYGNMNIPTQQGPAPSSIYGAVPSYLVSGQLIANLKPSSYATTAVPQVVRGNVVSGTLPIAAAYGASMTSGSIPGDWDNGIGLLPDGPYINKTDEGVAGANGSTINATDAYWATGYYDMGTGQPLPNRQVASGVQLGSLPTGINPIPASAMNTTTGDASGSYPQRPWQTLLFCANPPGRSTLSTSVPSGKDHYGFTYPQDHLWLDLFTMPAVQPYAISEPLSTAGKVNMNYQILPFNNIERSTAIRGVLDGTRMMALSTQEGDTSHGTTYKQSGFANEVRYDINADATLYGLQQRFNSGDIFHSPSEICDIFLMPQRISGASYGSAATPPTTYSSILAWWDGNASPTSPPTSETDFGLTGDNSREEPYKHIYPLLTTKSNSYRVYVRVQALRQIPSDQNAGTWTEGKSQIVGEYRGSYLIERYVDPSNPALPDFATNIAGTTTLPNGDSPSTSLDDYYRFRVLERKQFAP